MSWCDYSNVVSYEETLKIFIEFFFFAKSQEKELKNFLREMFQRPQEL